MPAGREPVRIAVNVMRARLTIVGFNLTITAFQLTILRLLPGGLPVPGADLSFHAGAAVALIMGVGLSITAMVCFIASSAFDQQGTCTHWSLLAGDLFMYLGLAETVAGFFSPTIKLLDEITLDVPAQMTELGTVRMAVVAGGGLAWLCAAYLGPAVSLSRSPFGWRTTTTLGAAYVILLLALAHVSAQAVRLEAASAGIDAGAGPTMLGELVQPLRW